MHGARVPARVCGQPRTRSVYTATQQRAAGVPRLLKNTSNFIHSAFEGRKTKGEKRCFDFEMLLICTLQIQRRAPGPDLTRASTSDNFLSALNCLSGEN